jgi:HEAT repeat protein
VNDPEPDVRVVVCAEWGKRGDAEAAAVLSGVLSSDIDKDVRMAAARGLGSTHDPVAITALGGALDDTDPAMQRRAVLSLKDVSGQDLGNDVDRWRVAVKSGSLKPGDSQSLAERFHRWIY